MFKNILRVEIELFSYCNRKCSWCPNSKIDRSYYQELDEEVFLQVIDDLKENNFGYMRDKFDKKFMTFNGYCEPTYNISLVKKRIEQVLQRIPTIEFMLSTNGDFLNEEFFNDIKLERFHIMDYDCKGIEYGLELFKKYKILLIEKLPEVGRLVGTHKHINQVVFQANWPKHKRIENRAGFLKEDIYYKGEKLQWRNNKELRLEGCVEPRNYITIDHKGNVMPCCHMRSDISEHAKYILGNVYKQKLSEIYNSKKAKEFRTRLFTSNNSNFPETCKYCNKVRRLVEKDRVMTREEQKIVEGPNYHKNRANGRYSHIWDWEI